MNFFSQDFHMILISLPHDQYKKYIIRGGATGSVHRQSLLDILSWSLREAPWSAGKEFLLESEALLLSSLIHDSVTVGIETFPCTGELQRWMVSPINPSLSEPSRYATLMSFRSSSNNVTGPWRLYGWVLLSSSDTSIGETALVTAYVGCEVGSSQSVRISERVVFNSRSTAQSNRWRFAPGYFYIFQSQ